MYKLLFFLFVLVSCSADINFYKSDNTYKSYKKIEAIFDKRFDYEPIKVLSSINNTIVTASKNHIYIYKDNKLVNKLGGIGFSNDNFSKISDFLITSTQNIAVLDGLQRQIKIFDLTGNWLTNIALDTFLHPALLAISQSDVYYIYDKDRDEISVSAHPEEQIDFTFGKFEIANPTLISIENYYLIVNNANGSSDIFDLTGQLLTHEDKNIQINRFGKYTLKGNFIFQDNVAKPIFLSPDTISFFKIKDNNLNVITKNRAVVLKLYYE